MQTLFGKPLKGTFEMGFIHYHDKCNFQSAHEVSNILPLQDLSSQSLSPFLRTYPTSSDLNSTNSDFSSPSSVSSNETKESVSLAKQSKKISKQEPEGQPQKAASKRGLWSSSEDAKLVSLVEEYGQKWTKISEMMPKKGRKQVRDRYLNALKPGINWGEWTKEEDNQFEVLHERFGNKWCEIAAHLPGRTENQVKNKYYWKKSQQPKQNATTSRKSKGKSCVKNAKPSSKFEAKRLEETETVSKSQGENFSLLDKILLFETDTEQISSILVDTELSYSEEPPRISISEDILKKDFLEEKSWSTEVGIQHPVYLYNDIDAYFCF